jgi:hypothetical protein
MRRRASVLNKLPALEWIGLPKHASVPVFALFFAALLSTIPINAHQFVSKLGSFGSDTNIIRIQRFRRRDLVYVAHTANERSQVFDKDGKSVFKSGVAENNDDQWNSPLAEGDRATFIFNGYCRFQAFSSRQVVDQICSYRFTLF